MLNPPHCLQMNTLLGWQNKASKFSCWPVFEKSRHKLCCLLSMVSCIALCTALYDKNDQKGSSKISENVLKVFMFTSHSNLAWFSFSHSSWLLIFGQPAYIAIL